MGGDDDVLLKAGLISFLPPSIELPADLNRWSGETFDGTLNHNYFA